MTSPSFRSKANGGGSTGANVTVNAPPGVVDNDIVLCFLSKDATGAVTWPGSWNILVEDTSNSFYGGIGWKRASSEPANYTWNFASTWRDAMTIAISGVVTGENPVDPDTPPAYVTSASATSLATNNLTTTTVDTLVIAFHNYININTWTAEPSGWTPRQNSSVNELHVMEQAFASAQTVTGPTQSTSGSAPGAFKAYIIALQSVSSGGGGSPILILQADRIFDKWKPASWWAKFR